MFFLTCSPAATSNSFWKANWIAPWMLSLVFACNLRNICKCIKHSCFLIALFSTWCLNNDFPPKIQGCLQPTRFPRTISENHIAVLRAAAPRPAGLFSTSSWCLVYVLFSLCFVGFFFFSFFFPSACPTKPVEMQQLQPCITCSHLPYFWRFPPSVFV